MPRDAAARIDPEELLKAYTLGFFPMARTRFDEHALWVMPEMRGVLPLNEARAPKRLLRTLRAEPYEVTIDAAFAEVIAACAKPTKSREDTWINHAIEEAFMALHAAGFAHSVECRREGKLVGGLYGLALGEIFCGESMFSTARDASKIAMLHLIARLKHAGFKLLDTQFHTDHLAQFGVRECPNADYQEMLKTMLARRPDFRKAPLQLSALTVLQSITQTS
ncbi:MAG TPA: leucyl/phenylalanyl-tRNA--protein transferase [Parvularcula sp.]|nr:leucyl/phenylalanyl-tRNA--protein transferase [Parvularcula sp.]HBS31951.1 leucyl/phenylalanyl-tRNA--protein transferase [Parvularcula sp.]HBS35415.1 leucyl/phenylalanyl-tRNA--protein transferase [Parvularcula sp.]